MVIWPYTKSNNQTTISICIDVWSICFIFFFLCFFHFGSLCSVVCHTMWWILLFLHFFYSYPLPSISPTIHSFCLSFDLIETNLSSDLHTYIPNTLYTHIFILCSGRVYRSTIWVVIIVATPLLKEEKRKTQHNQAQIKWEMPIDFSK